MEKTTYVAAVSVDKGLVRSNNEDNFYFNGTHLLPENRDNHTTLSGKCEDDIQIFGVFDGMGGEAYGEVASLISAETLKQFHGKLTSERTDVKRSVIDAVTEANTQICNKILAYNSKRIGATFAAIAFEGNTATVFNVGDSRIYMLHNEEFRQISVDDTMAQRLVNLGMITPEEAQTHKDRHILTQHLGIFREEMIIEPHMSFISSIANGDKFLICSDGLTDMLSDREIQDILAQNLSCEELSEQLVLAALNRGGRDNVTAVVVEATVKNISSPAKKFIKFFVPIALAVTLIIGFGVYALFNVWPKGETKPNDVSKKTTICFSQPVQTMTVGSEGVFTVTPDDEDFKGNVTFSCDDPSVIKVDRATGKYKALKPGKTVVAAKYNERECSMEIEVFDRESDKDSEEKFRKQETQKKFDFEMR